MLDVLKSNIEKLKIKRPNIDLKSLFCKGDILNSEDWRTVKKTTGSSNFFDFREKIAQVNGSTDYSRLLEEAIINYDCLIILETSLKEKIVISLNGNRCIMFNVGTKNICRQNINISIDVTLNINHMIKLNS